MSLAEDRVKRLQTQYVALGQSTSGVTKALAVRPLNLFNADAAIGTQRMQIFNKLMADGSTQLVNWGKNTQWAGRQLMVGFTVPLTLFGSAAAKIFMDLEKSMISFKKVYGDATTTDAQTNRALSQIQGLAEEYTKYGIAVKDTIALSAKAAAMGAQGKDLYAQTEQATRLATLGEMEYQQALDTTISLQSAFGISSEKLGDSINFLNAVENQTVLSLQDVTTAIPTVAPVIKGLGGDVRDLAVFLTAMREGGVDAAEGANALKSGMASLIKPTKAAREAAASYGISIEEIAEKNKGDLMGMVKDFSVALESLDQFDQQKLLTTVFGKYQFARMGAMFKNLARDGSQASRAMELMSHSTEELAAAAENELGAIADSVSTKFTGAVERLKLAIAPVGEMFLKMATPVVDAVTGIANWFNQLPDIVKQGSIAAAVFLGVLAPGLTMVIGLLANGIGNMIKFVNWIRGLGQGIRGAGADMQYLSTAELDAMAASASLEGRTHSLTNALNMQRGAVSGLVAAYSNMSVAANNAMLNVPQGFRLGRIKGFAGGRVGRVAGSGRRDSELVALTPGESVVTAAGTRNNQGALAAINAGKTIRGFADGVVGFKSTFENKFGRQVDLRADERKLYALVQEIELAGGGLIDEFRTIIASMKEGTVSLGSIISDVQKSSSAQLKTIAKNHEQLGKTNAPTAYLNRQNAAWAGSGRSAQQDYVAKAVQGYNLSADQLKQLTLVNASHMTKSEDKYGFKTWTANNVIPDVAAVNKYIESLKVPLAQISKDSPAFAQIFDKAKKLGLSQDELVTELNKMGQGIHPVTLKAHAALESFAAVDLEMRKLAAAAGLASTSLGSEAKNLHTAAGAKAGSEWIRKYGGQQSIDNVRGAYAGANDYVGPKTVVSSLGSRSSLPGIGVKVQQEAAKQGQKTALQLVDGAAVGMRKGVDAHSPARRAIPIGEDVGDGFLKGLSASIKGAFGKGQQAYKPQRAAIEEAPAKSRTGSIMKLLTIVDSISLALSFVPGQVGEWSQQILFGTMGLQGLIAGFAGLRSMLSATRFAGLFAPLATSGLAASGALGALLSPVGLAVAALGALGLIAWSVYKHYDDQKKAMENFGVAMKNSTKTMQTFAQQFGYKQLVGSIDTQTIATDKGARDRAYDAQTAVRENYSNDEDFKKRLDALKATSIKQAESVLRQMFMNLIASGAPADVAKSIVEQIANETNKQNVFKGISDSLSAALDKKGKIKDVAKYVKDTLAPGYESAADSAAKIAEQEKLIAGIKARGTKWTQSSSGHGMQQVLTKDAQKQVAEAQARIRALSIEAEQFKANMGTVAAAVATDLNLMAANGMLTQEQFNQAFSNIEQGIQQAFGGDINAQLGAYREAINSLNGDYATVTASITDTGVAAATLKAVMAGADSSAIVAALNNTTASAYETVAALNAAATAALSSPVGGAAGGAAAEVASLGNQIANLKRQQAGSRRVGGGGGGGSKPKSGGGGGGPKKSKYDKKADKLAKAGARLDIAEVKIDKKGPAKIRAALQKRFGGTTFTIGGMKIALKNAEDIEYAVKQIEERIEDINRNEIDPLNEKLEKLEKEQDKINHQIQLWQNKIDEINESYEAQIDPLQTINDRLQAQAEILEDQRDRALDGINLQIAALENQAEAAEYAAEQQTRLIDEQIDKNNKYKELIDKQIQAIDDQVAALEEVEKINEIIANQQQRQLELASALSRGDAGAAAQAMVSGQAGAAQDNSAMQKSGMENQKKPLEDQSKSISDANDLLERRKEAIDKGVEALNRQLAALNQQKSVIENTYKVQLTAIAQEQAANNARINQLKYAQSLAVKYWQDQINNYAPRLRDLDLQIYKINQQIKAIEDAKIKPLEKQRDLLEDIADDVQTALNREKASIEQKRKQLEFANKLNNAMKTLHDKAKSAAGAAAGIGKALGGSGAAAVNDVSKKIKKLQEQFNGAKFRLKIEQGLVVRTGKGRLLTFDSPEKAIRYTIDAMDGSKVVTKNDIQGQVKIGGRIYKGDYRTLTNKIGNTMNDKVSKPIVLSMYQDARARKIRVRTRQEGGSTAYSFDGGRTWAAARGGLIPGAGGILPGFRGVTHGDNVNATLRSGEGVTVSEALRNNNYETKRLLALNKAALSGNMSGFYKEFAEPRFSIAPAITSGVMGESGGITQISNEYTLNIPVQQNANPDDIANAVMYKIKSIENSQVRIR